MTTPNPKSVFDKAIEAHLRRVHTSAIGVVEAFSDADGNPVTTVRFVYDLVLNNGTRVTQGRIYNVPVMPLDWGDFLIYAPLNKGDFVEIRFFEQDVKTWLRTGKDTQKADDAPRFEKNNAVVMRKIRPQTDSLPDDVRGKDALVLASKDGSTRLEIQDGRIVVHAGDVRLGSEAASDAIALSPGVDTFFTFIDTLFTTWSPVPTDGGASLKAAYAAARAITYPTGIPSTASNKVKAE